MISSEIRKWLKKVQPLDKLGELVIGTCPLSGSYVFGGYDPETSDRDVLMSPKHNRCNFGYDRLCYASGDYNKKEFQSFYAKTEEGVVYNLLFFYTQECFEKYKWATDKMVDDVRRLSHNFTDKEYRIETFEQYKKHWEKGHE